MLAVETFPLDVEEPEPFVVAPVVELAVGWPVPVVETVDVAAVPVEDEECEEVPPVDVDFVELDDVTVVVAVPVVELQERFPLQ